jgi:hypothetical protein
MTRFTQKARVVLHGKPAAAVVCVLLALTLTSCKHNETGGPEGSQTAKARPQVDAVDGVKISGGRSYAHVTYKPEVKTLDVAQVDASLAGISTDGNVFVFQNADPQIRALKEGDGFLIKDQLARKVLAAKTDGDQTAILTDSAAITDVVQDGDIQIDTPLGFSAVKQASELRPYGRGLMDIFGEPGYAGSTPPFPCWAPGNAAAGSAKAIIGSMIEDWTITKWSVTPGANVLDFNLVLTKNTGGFVAMVSMTGFVSNFDFVSNISVLQGSGSKMFTGVKNMTGKIQFDWEIGKGTPGGWSVEDRIKLPAGITIPLDAVLGGMPLSLEISSALLIHPALTGGDELSRGGFTITWKGGGNISARRGATPSGDSNMQLSFQVTKDTNVSPIAPNGMVISYCAPRLELKFKVFGKYASALCSFAAGITGIDNIATAMEAMLPASVKQALAQSPLSNVTAANVLSSKADVYVQFISTEGVTHSSNQTPFPCSKQELKLTGQGGGEAQLFGLTKGASTTTDLFTKTFTRWDPASDFCKKI